ncbi:MAG TPA: pyruvate dehydrogenase complex dihydrolipoamide acetyltransferase [Roseococcus sp.]|jgi:pyruvate dehydrogenase E2 component (dihydrolipoamide acetyltransferase)|nr:pyruvate dehydrogenase complex dihydrolipoamide acetyltransferase [Roseococcus sp.]
MATNILMPALSPTMTEGTLARWLKKEGEVIKAGDIIAEIETDKATMEVEAVDEGILGKILVGDGTEGVKVNDVIAVLVEKGEVAPDAAAPKPAAKAEAPAPAPAAPKAEPAKPAPAPASGGDRVFASPLARRMAQQAGIELAAVTGSGPQGRIVKADVEAAMNRPAAPKRDAAPVTAEAGVAGAPAAPKPAPAPVHITAPHMAVPNSSMRKVIARRLTESKTTVPHFYVAMDFELDALLKLRADLNAQSPKEGAGAFKLSVNDLIIKACAVALRRHPGVNAAWTDEAILQFQDVDISVAVAIPDGLITPIVKGADRKGLATISNEMKDLGARAKAGKLKPEEFQGGGFSISNMGMYGVSFFSAIINPPQAGILAVGAGEQRPVVRNGALAIATVMTCQLSVDHRVVDGALAAEFMATLKGLIENPLSLML